MISIEIKLLSIHLNLLSIVFPFKPQRNLLIRKDFNWNHFTFTSNWIYFQVMFLLNFKEVYWQERISIETNLLSIHSNLLSIDFPFKTKKKAPKVVVHNRVPCKQLYYWVSGPLIGYPLEKWFGCCFLNKVFNKASNYLENLAF